MNARINVIKKGSTAKPEGSVCPWVLDIPPETSSK
jgi:hypothetical protein